MEVNEAPRILLSYGLVGVRTHEQISYSLQTKKLRAGEGTDCGSGGDVTGGRLTGLSSALPFPLHL